MTRGPALALARKRVFPVRTTRSSETAPDSQWKQTPTGFVSLAEYREARHG